MISLDIAELGSNGVEWTRVAGVHWRLGDAVKPFLGKGMRISPIDFVFNLTLKSVHFGLAWIDFDRLNEDRLCGSHLYRDACAWMHSVMDTRLCVKDHTAAQRSSETMRQ